MLTLSEENIVPLMSLNTNCETLNVIMGHFNLQALSHEYARFNSPKTQIINSKYKSAFYY